MSSQIVRARRAARRRAAAALIVAASGFSLFHANHALAATYSFTVDFADMLDSTAWTPNGVPTGTDLAFFKRRAGGDLTNIDITLNNGSITLGAMEYDTSRVRNIYNPDTINASTLTLVSLPGRPLIQMN